MDRTNVGILLLSIAIVFGAAAMGFVLRMMHEPPCDDTAIRTEYDAYRATTMEHLRHRAIADSLKAIEIDSLKAMLDRPVRPLVQVLDDHRRAAQDASLDTVRAGLLNGVE